MDLIPTERGCQFRHTRDLLSLLFTVAPEIAADPNLVSRSVLLTGLSRHTTPEDLLGLLPLETYASVVVRDYQTGERAGLVVLANEGDCEEAMSSKTYMARDFYRDCIKARVGQKPFVLAEAARDHARRRDTSDLLQHLLPAIYVQEDSSLHLRCVFLRRDAFPPAALPFDVSSLGEALPAKGGGCVRAIVACKAQSIGAVVYDDAYSAEEVGMSFVGSRPLSFRMYESAMFPFRPFATEAAVAAAAAPGDQLRGMIPRFYTHPEYLERILLLRGLDTERCDARDVACLISNGLEALIVHRSQQLVVAVFSNKEEALLQLHETAENWMSIFGLPLTCEVVHAPQIFGAQDDEQDLVAPAGGPYPGLHRKATDKVLDRIKADTKKCAPEYAPEIAKLLIRLTVLSRPGALRHKYFPDRAVLLLGIHPTRNRGHLSEALSTYGGLDALTICSVTCAALAVFKRWDAAFRLLQEPTERCQSMGFCKCQRVPGAEHASKTADEEVAELSRFDAQLKMSQVPEFYL